MATARFIINGALRKIGRLGGGREARPADAQDTLDALRSLYRSWIVSGAFGRLCDVIPASNYTARPNERIFRRDANVTTITLPETVAGQGCRWNYVSGALEDIDDENGEAITDDTGENLEFDDTDYREGTTNTTPRDCSVVVIVDSGTGSVAEFLYDGSIKVWQHLAELTIEDEAPRSHADPQGLMACLAAEIADQFGGEISPLTMMQAARYKQALTSRWSFERQSVPGVYV